ncbi:MAG: ATP-binding protein [Pseudomonadota bacterium]
MRHDPAATHVSADPPATAAGGVLSRTVFRATFENVRLAISKAKDAMAPLKLTDEDESSIELILAEALNNVVEHAYPPGHDGNVKLVLRHGRAGLLIEIRDTGRPMPNGRTPLGLHPHENHPENALPEGGYGWYLIRQLTTDVVYDRENGENFLIFRVPVGTLEE